MQGQINPITQTGNLQGTMSTEGLIGGQVVGMRGFRGEKGEQGDAGNGIASAVLNDDYTLTLVFTDGTSYTTPSIRGEHGEDGTDGRDGYTPIKGVDYFDGQNGRDGQDGEDGFSPTATVSKVGKVATITVTDKDGTTTVDVRDGEDGHGVGDMLKSTYDTDNSGVVDAAESVAWSGITGKPTEFNPTSHTHTKAQITDYDGISDAPSDHKQYVRQDGDWEEVEIMTSVDWNDVENKPSTFPPESHAHDDRYYTEAETDTLLGEKENKGKITISGTESTVITHTLTITDSGVTTSYTLLGL